MLGPGHLEAYERHACMASGTCAEPAFVDKLAFEPSATIKELVQELASSPVPAVTACAANRSHDEELRPSVSRNEGVSGAMSILHCKCKEHSYHPNASQQDAGVGHSQ